MNALLDKAKPGDRVKLPPLYKSRLWLIGFTFFKARRCALLGFFLPAPPPQIAVFDAPPSDRRCRFPPRSSLQGGNLSNFFALAFAPQSLLSALAAIQFVSNVVFARVLLRERASGRTLLGVATIVSGIMLLVIFGAHTSKAYTPMEIDALYVDPWFIAYMCILFPGAAAAFVKFRAAESGLTDAAFVRASAAKAYRSLLGGKVSRATLAVRNASGARGHKRTRSDAAVASTDTPVRGAAEGAAAPRKPRRRACGAQGRAAGRRR